MPDHQTANELQVVEYRAGMDGFQDVAKYDERRYAGLGNEYKRTITANAYKRLIGPLAGKRILDVGCGTGRGVADFAREAKSATGADASLDMIAAARRKVDGRSNCAFVASYAQHLPFPDNYFDVVTTLNFLHLFNLENQRQMVAEMIRVAKPGGAIILEFDNALHGLAVGLYKRWFRDERGSLPWEIRYVIDGRARVARVYGAVLPILWRVFCRFPRLFSTIDKIAYFPPFSRLYHRIYYKLIKEPRLR